MLNHPPPRPQLATHTPQSEPDLDSVRTLPQAWFLDPVIETLALISIWTLTLLHLISPNSSRAEHVLNRLVSRVSRLDSIREVTAMTMIFTSSRTQSKASHVFLSQS